MKPDRITKHSLGLSVLLHLLPGVLIGGMYFAAVRPLHGLGFPSIAALILAALIILGPLETGILFFAGKNEGASKWADILQYRQPMPLWQSIGWIVVIFVSVGIIMTLLTPVTSYLKQFFGWLPDVYHLDLGLSGDYSRSTLIITYVSFFFVLALVAPTVEEFYFRGYLLPRMPELRGWSPVLHSTLFALYHTWTPWMVLTRTLGVLPLIYIVRRKRNLYLGVVAHCMLNAIDIVVGLAFILQMAS